MYDLSDFVVCKFGTIHDNFAHTPKSQLDSNTRFPALECAPRGNMKRPGIKRSEIGPEKLAEEKMNLKKKGGIWSPQMKKTWRIAFSEEAKRMKMIWNEANKTRRRSVEEHVMIPIGTTCNEAKKTRGRSAEEMKMIEAA